MQKHVNLVDLVKSFPTNIYLQNLASIQPRTSPVKFAHLAEKSGKGSIPNLSTKVRRGRRDDAPRDQPRSREAKEAAGAGQGEGRRGPVRRQSGGWPGAHASPAPSCAYGYLHLRSTYLRALKARPRTLESCGWRVSFLLFFAVVELTPEHC